MAIQDTIRDLANKYAQELERKMSARVSEMATDDKSHYLIYRVLGISDQEGELIDVYQNKGRFVYKYAGVYWTSPQQSRTGGSDDDLARRLPYSLAHD